MSLGSAASITTVLMSNLNPHGIAPPIYQSSVWAVSGTGPEGLSGVPCDQVHCRLVQYSLMRYSTVCCAVRCDVSVCLSVCLFVRIYLFFSIFSSQNFLFPFNSFSFFVDLKSEEEGSDGRIFVCASERMTNFHMKYNQVITLSKKA